MSLFRPDISELSDGELLRRSRDRGGADYFGALYGRYIPLLYGVCLKYLRRPDLAEDAVMGLFEHLQPRIGRYEIRDFRTWIYSAAKNHCLQQLRGSGREIPTESVAGIMESAGIVHLLEEEGDDERLAALRDCIAKLPDAQRTSIRHFFTDGMSYADIARQTGWKLKSVKSFIQNAKRNLKNCMDKATRP